MGVFSALSVGLTLYLVGTFALGQGQGSGSEQGRLLERAETPTVAQKNDSSSGTSAQAQKDEETTLGKSYESGIDQSFDFLNRYLNITSFASNLNLLNTDTVDVSYRMAVRPAFDGKGKYMRVDQYNVVAPMNLVSLLGDGGPLSVIPQPGIQLTVLYPRDNITDGVFRRPKFIFPKNHKIVESLPEGALVGARVFLTVGVGGSSMIPLADHLGISPSLNFSEMGDLFLVIYKPSEKEVITLFFVSRSKSFSGGLTIGLDKMDPLFSGSNLFSRTLNRLFWNRIGLWIARASGSKSGEDVYGTGFLFHLNEPTGRAAYDEFLKALLRPKNLVRAVWRGNSVTDVHDMIHELIPPDIKNETAAGRPLYQTYLETEATNGNSGFNALGLLRAEGAKGCNQSKITSFLREKETIFHTFNTCFENVGGQKVFGWWNDWSQKTNHMLSKTDSYFQPQEFLSYALTQESRYNRPLEKNWRILFLELHRFFPGELMAWFQLPEEWRSRGDSERNLRVFSRFKLRRPQKSDWVLNSNYQQMKSKVSEVMSAVLVEMKAKGILPKLRPYLAISGRVDVHREQDLLGFYNPLWTYEGDIQRISHLLALGFHAWARGDYGSIKLGNWSNADSMLTQQLNEVPVFRILAPRIFIKLFGDEKGREIFGMGLELDERSRNAFRQEIGNSTSPIEVWLNLVTELVRRRGDVNYPYHEMTELFDSIKQRMVDQETQQGAGENGKNGDSGQLQN